MPPGLNVRSTSITSSTLSAVPIWAAVKGNVRSAGDFASAVQAYEMALKLLPDQAEIANDMGRLAFRLGMAPQAEKLFPLLLLLLLHGAQEREVKEHRYRGRIRQREKQDHGKSSVEERQQTGKR